MFQLVWSIPTFWVNGLLLFSLFAPFTRELRTVQLRNEVEEYIHKIQEKIRRTIDQKLAKKVLESCYLSDENCIWFVYKSDPSTNNFKLDFDASKIYNDNILQQHEWSNLWKQFTGKGGGDINQYWIPETITSLSYIPDSIPNIEVIPAIREIGQSGSEASDFSGKGIIERLAKIQNPSYINQHEKEKFSSINEFVQNVLENSSAKIEIPFERDMILVHMDGRTLPLDSLGTGIHEVIILAAASIILENTIICVEEPELHLHPLLQKKLVKYLSEQTNNQYIFTTHSAHLLDAVDAEIFHVTHKQGSSYVDAISSTKQRSDICNDLGYKASDILQANCVIWVEGPSDRIYLNYWLKDKEEDLIEGIHYSIMFFGGRLFSHLTALDDDEETERIDDLISVRKLNRHSAIIFDSDKSSPDAQILDTKQRLKEEFSQDPGFAWVTEGREIENYLNMDKLEEAVLEVHPSAEQLISKNQWSNLLKYKKKNSADEKTANKVNVARYYTKNNPADLNILDLETKLDELINFIAIANGHKI